MVPGLQRCFQGLEILLATFAVPKFSQGSLRNDSHQGILA
jgi:hypothetical protein